tara:strand:- start:845 stop:1114 length:270 start_codon:yes stop_codon:yes gene_type:complete
MITSEQFSEWLANEDMTTFEIENGVKVDTSNPWGEIDEKSEFGAIRLVDGTIHIDWVDSGWNGYGEEQFTDIDEFSARFTDVMNNGLTG